MKMSYKLFVDDIRNPREDGWTVARSFDEAISIIREKGFPRFVSFDHDLGDDSPSGKDLANWMVEMDLDLTFSFPRDFGFVVHSANPVGKKNIESLLNQYLNWR